MYFALNPDQLARQQAAPHLRGAPRLGRRCAGADGDPAGLRRRRLAGAGRRAGPRRVGCRPGQRIRRHRRRPRDPRPAALLRPLSVVGPRR